MAATSWGLKVLAAVIVSASSCSRIELTYSVDATVLRFRVEAAQCEQLGTRAVCELSGVHREGWPFERADATTGVQVILLVEGIGNQATRSEPRIRGYVLHGGIAPDEDDVWEITEAHVSRWADAGPWLMTGELVCGKVLASNPKGSPRTAIIRVRGVSARWSHGVAASVHEPFLLRKIPALALWPQTSTQRVN